MSSTFKFVLTCSPFCFSDVMSVNKESVSDNLYVMYMHIYILFVWIPCVWEVQTVCLDQLLKDNLLNYPDNVAQ